MANYIITECLTNDVYIFSSSTTLISGQTIGFLIGEEEVHCGTVGVVTSIPETPTISFISYETDCCTCLTNTGVPLNFYFKRCDNLNYVCIEGTDFCNSFGLPTTGLTYEIQFESEAPFCATFESLCSAGVRGYDWVSGPHEIECECGEEPPLSGGSLNVTATTCDGYSQLIILPGDVEFSESSIYQLPNGQCVSLISGETTTFYANSMIIAGPFEDCDECAQPFSANTGGNNGEVCVIDCSGNTVTVTPPHPVYTNGQNQAIVQINAITIGGNGLNS